jgi:hypothetical protein
VQEACVPELEETTTGGSPPMSTCKSHEYVVETMKRLERGQNNGFARLESKLEAVSTQQSARITELSTAQAVANTEMRLLNERLAERIADVSATVDDVTEVGIKGAGRGKSARSYDTPSSLSPPRRGLRRVSPRGLLAIGAGMVIAVALIGYFVGVWSTSGSSDTAAHSVKAIVVPLVSPDDNTYAAQPDAPKTTTATATTDPAPNGRAL